MKTVLLMVGTQKGAFLFRSDEHRRSWQIDGPLMKGWKVNDVQLDLRGAPRMFAAVGSYVYGPTINVSDDLGQSWRQIEKGPSYPADVDSKLKDIWCVVPGIESEPETLYSGVADAGMFVSRDRGESWKEFEGLRGHPTREEWTPGLGGLCCHSILVDPNNSQRIWAGISSVGVFRSDDGGKSWTVKNDGLEIVIPTRQHKDIGSCVHRLVIDPHDSTRLFQQNHKGLFRSTDAGDSWQRIESGIPSNFGFPMVVHPQDSNTLFVIPLESDEFRLPMNGQLAVYRSDNAGDSWHDSSEGLPANFYAGIMRQAMAYDTIADNCGIYFGTSGGQIFYSRDNGNRWEAMDCQLPRINSISVAVLDG